MGKGPERGFRMVTIYRLGVDWCKCVTLNDINFQFSLLRKFVIIIFTLLDPVCQPWKWWNHYSYSQVKYSVYMHAPTGNDCLIPASICMYMYVYSQFMLDKLLWISNITTNWWLSNFSGLPELFNTVIKFLIHITCNYSKEYIVVITNMPATCPCMYVAINSPLPLLDLIRWPQECQNIPTSNPQSCVCTCPHTPGINNSHTSLSKSKLLGKN